MTQILGSIAVGSTAACICAACSREQAEISPEEPTTSVRPPTPLMNSRRSDVKRAFGSDALLISGLPRRALYGPNDAVVGSTPADVRAHVRDDLLARGIRVPCEQVGRAHDLA